MLPCAIVSKLCILIKRQPDSGNLNSTCAVSPDAGDRPLSPDAGRQPDSGKLNTYYMCDVAGCRRFIDHEVRMPDVSRIPANSILHMRCRRMPAIHLLCRLCHQMTSRRLQQAMAHTRLQQAMAHMHTTERKCKAREIVKHAVFSDTKPSYNKLKLMRCTHYHVRAQADACTIPDACSDYAIEFFNMARTPISTPRQNSIHMQPSHSLVA